MIGEQERQVQDALDRETARMHELSENAERFRSQYRALMGAPEPDAERVEELEGDVAKLDRDIARSSARLGALAEQKERARRADGEAALAALGAELREMMPECRKTTAALAHWLAEGRPVVEAAVALQRRALDRHARMVDIAAATGAAKPAAPTVPFVDMGKQGSRAVNELLEFVREELFQTARCRTRFDLPADGS